jgi:hypothetical protein
MAYDTPSLGTLGNPSMTAPCIDCGLEIVPDDGKCEWYMVHDTVWFAAGMPERPIGYEGDWLCIGCLERRLGRALTRADFKYPDSHNDGQDSDRLLSRLAP